MKKLELGNNLYSLLDNDIFEDVNRWKWKTNNSGYVRRTKTLSNNGNKTFKTVYLHRYVLNEPSGKEVDHINKNKLDNRRENLRLVTHSQNHWNTNAQSNSKSGIKGVSYSKVRDLWCAFIKVNGKNINLGGFLDKHSAKVAYGYAVAKYFII